MNQTHRRPTKPARAADAETDFLDLDALVLAEIESLTAFRDATHAGKATAAAAPTPVPEDAESKPGPKTRAKVKASVAPIRSAPERRRESFGEEAELLFEEPDPLVEYEKDEAPSGLLSPEEEAFITRAVGFLSQRPEADIILNRIWEQLTELDPEGYYQAPLDSPDGTLGDGPSESGASASSSATPPAGSPED